MRPRYRLEHVVRRYPTARSSGHIEALCVPALEVAAGEVLGVVGPNGSGKSTLLETMAFLAKPEQGRVFLDGRDIWAERASLDARRRCPMLLQHTVLFKTSVLKNVMYGLRAGGMSRRPARERAEQVLQMVQLDKLAYRTQRELSGGERRRVALARLLALEPDALLLDEPTAHVDQANAQMIEATIERLHATTGMTVILASHDLRQAQTLADRIVTMLDGRLYFGPMDNLFAGTLRAEEGGFAFYGENGLSFPIARQAIVFHQPEAPAKLAGTAVRITIDADRLEIQPGHAANDGGFGGTVESVHRRKDRCQVIVRLESGHQVCATLPQSDYVQLSLNIGSCVRVRVAEQALRIIPTRV